jgi:hypothetical protein
VHQIGNQYQTNDRVDGFGCSMTHVVDDESNTMREKLYLLNLSNLMGWKAEDALF